jgi:fumarate reductase subunit D
MNNQWLIIPPNYVILIFSFLVLFLAILGFKDKSNKFAKLRSWISTVLSSILIFILIVIMSFTAMFSGSKELLKTAHSPGEKYTINFYKTDAGAMGTHGILGELEGPLWFKRVIYYEQKVDQVDLEWENNHTVLINDRKLDLMKGDTSILQ